MHSLVTGVLGRTHAGPDKKSTTCSAIAKVQQLPLAIRRDFYCSFFLPSVVGEQQHFQGQYCALGRMSCHLINRCTAFTHQL